MLLGFLAFSGRSMLEVEAPEPPEADPWHSDPIEEDRRRVIDELMSLNPSAQHDFLETFSTDSLREYLEHLHSSQCPRGRQARWARTRVSRGIVCYDCAN